MIATTRARARQRVREWCLLAGLAASGCAANGAYEAAASPGMFDAEMAAGEDGFGSIALDARVAPRKAEPVAAEEQRRLVRSGEITVAVGDPDAAAATASEKAKALGGYVQQWTQSFVLLRVPAERWDELLKGVEELGRVVDRNLRVQDVTDEYHDLELELGTLRTLATRLTALLERAEDVSSALEVERELGRVRGEIERIEGRIAFLAQRVQYATLQVNLTQISERGPRGPGLPFPWLKELGVERLLGIRR